MNAQQIICILEREETNANNAADMRRVMRDERLTLVSALQRKPVRGVVVRYDGVGEVETGGVSERDVSDHLRARMAEALNTLRLWHVLVTIEEMPDYHRSSHRAARNWGQYPHNGATRRLVTPAEAEEIIAADPDGYAHIVD